MDYSEGDGGGVPEDASGEPGGKGSGVPLDSHAKLAAEMREEGGEGNLYHDWAARVEALGRVEEKKAGVTARLEKVLGPRLDGWSQSLPCGCILSVERFLSPCEAHKDSPPIVGESASKEEKKAAFLETAMALAAVWHEANTAPSNIGKWGAFMDAYRALVEAEKESGT